MADETTAPETTESSVAPETSTNEETQDTEATSLEDTAVSFDGEDDDETDETYVETETEDSANSDDAETKEESKEDAEESATEEDADNSNDKEKPAVVDEKEQARQAYEARQREKAERTQVEQAKREAQQKYLDDADDDKDLALRQLQIDAYNNRVESNTNKLEAALERSVNSIPEFRDGTPAVQKRLAKAVENFDNLYVEKDRNGDPIQVKGNLYEYLQSEIADIRDLLGDGARAQTKSKTAQKARTMTPPVKAPKEAKKTSFDDMLAGFDEEVDKYR